MTQGLPIKVCFRLKRTGRGDKGYFLLFDITRFQKLSTIYEENSEHFKFIKSKKKKRDGFVGKVGGVCVSRGFFVFFGRSVVVDQKDVKKKKKCFILTEIVVIK